MLLEQHENIRQLQLRLEEVERKASRLDEVDRKATRDILNVRPNHVPSLSARCMHFLVRCHNILSQAEVRGKSKAAQDLQQAKDDLEEKNRSLRSELEVCASACVNVWPNL